MPQVERVLPVAGDAPAQRLATPEDFAGRGADRSGQDTHESGLATAVGAGDLKNLAGIQRETNALEQGTVVPFESNIAAFQNDG